MKSGVVRRSTSAARLDLRRNCRPYGPVPYGAFDIRKR
ncbi:transposase, partial [Burkholderia pseudomallei 354a]